MNVWRILFAAAILAGAQALSVGVAAPSALAATPAAQPAAASAQAAVQQAVTASGSAYAGDCASARSPQDLGKICSKLVTSRADVSAYMAGRTFSEFDTWLFVQKTAAGWCSIGSAPLDAASMTASIPWPSTAPAASCTGSAAR